MMGDGSDGGIQNYDASSQDIESQITQNQLELHQNQEAYRQKVFATVKGHGQQDWGHNSVK